MEHKHLGGNEGGIQHTKMTTNKRPISYQMNTMYILTTATCCSHYK